MLVITSTDGFELSATEVEMIGQGIETDLVAVPDTVDLAGDCWGCAYRGRRDL